jgi:hypothetical protein
LKTYRALAAGVSQNRHKSCRASFVPGAENFFHRENSRQKIIPGLPSQQRRISRTLCTQMLAMIPAELICAPMRGGLKQKVA